MLNTAIKQIAFVGLLWIVATIVRLPNLNRPLSRHHEFSNAAVLRTLTIWAQRGITSCNFVPSMTFSNLGDQDIHLKNAFEESFNDGRQRYYTSLGAMQYLLPYAFNRVLGLTNTNRNLVLLNLLLHFFALFGVFRIATLCFPERPLVSIYSTLVYAFSPGLLWFHGNVYVHESALLPFLYLNLYLYLKGLCDKKVSFSTLLLFFATVFCSYLWTG